MPKAPVPSTAVPSSNSHLDSLLTRAPDVRAGPLLPPPSISNVSPMRRGRPTKASSAQDENKVNGFDDSFAPPTGGTTKDNSTPPLLPPRPPGSKSAFADDFVPPPSSTRLSPPSSGSIPQTKWQSIPSTDAIGVSSPSGTTSPSYSSSQPTSATFGDKIAAFDRQRRSPRNDDDKKGMPLQLTGDKSKSLSRYPPLDGPASETTKRSVQAEKPTSNHSTTTTSTAPAMPPKLVNRASQTSPHLLDDWKLPQSRTRTSQLYATEGRQDLPKPTQPVLNNHLDTRSSPAASAAATGGMSPHKFSPKPPPEDLLTGASDSTLLFESAVGSSASRPSSGLRSQPATAAAASFGDGHGSRASSEFRPRKPTLPNSEAAAGQAKPENNRTGLRRAYPRASHTSSDEEEGPEEADGRSQRFKQQWDDHPTSNRDSQAAEVDSHPSGIRSAASPSFQISSPQVSSSRASSFEEEDGEGGGNFDLDKALSSIRRFAPSTESRPPSGRGGGGRGDAVVSVSSKASSPAFSVREMSTGGMPSSSARTSPPLPAPSPRPLGQRASISNLVSRFETYGNNRADEQQQQQQQQTRVKQPPAAAEKPASLRSPTTARRPSSGSNSSTKQHERRFSSSSTTFDDRFPSVEGLDARFAQAAVTGSTAVSVSEVATSPPPPQPPSQPSSANSTNVANNRPPFKPKALRATATASTVRESPTEASFGSWKPSPSPTQFQQQQQQQHEPPRGKSAGSGVGTKEEERAPSPSQERFEGVGKLRDRWQAAIAASNAGRDGPASGSGSGGIRRASTIGGGGATGHSHSGPPKPRKEWRAV
jgi:hypothetical protein